jgi:hypothetical protein
MPYGWMVLSTDGPSRTTVVRGAVGARPMGQPAAYRLPGAAVGRGWYP